MEYCSNPTSRQFKAAYRRLLHLHDNMLVTSGNCVAQGSTTLLPSCSTSSTNFSLLYNGSKKYNFSEVAEIPDCDDNYLYSLSDPLSPVISTTVTSIAGFVVRQLITSLDCKHCTNALYTPPPSDRRFILIKLKDNGGLIYPSADVIKVNSLLRRSFGIF